MVKMLNAEKYKNEINYIMENYCADGILCAVNKALIHNRKCNYRCETCKKNAMRWLSQEYKEPVLTDKEKIIIKDIIKAFKPFGAEVKCIAKYRHSDEPTDYYLNFNYENNDELDTFTFNGDELFMGMEVDELYTLEELGL